MLRTKSTSCDIFCNVIDNYGDIGVCWRLARQLANEHGVEVRLWVDDLSSLAKMCHEADAAHDIQHCRGVELRRWVKPFTEVQPAELVIEAFACKLPQDYINAMATQQQSVWVNLEYLSAEDWVEGCHKLPSPHPSLPLIKYFFFPGFTGKTGGLLLERDLFARRDAFQGNEMQQLAFWQSYGVEVPGADTLKISLFGYENDSLGGLFDTWASGAQPVFCLVPEGRVLPQVRQYFGDTHSGSSYIRGNLKVCVLPFVEQERYDELLWACDVNFVRGEDSCVRAQWAARPFIWQIYPQQDAVHWNKLQAFLKLYNAPLSVAARQAMEGMWLAWNGGTGHAASTKSLILSPVEGSGLVTSTGSGQATSTGSGHAWSAFNAVRGELNFRAQGWAQELAANNLAWNLLDFCKKIGRMHAFKNEGQ